MFERPTKLDWLVYKVFAWFWNPIFARKPWLLFGIKREIDRWVADFERSVDHDVTYDDWLHKVESNETLKKPLP